MAKNMKNQAQCKTIYYLREIEAVFIRRKVETMKEYKTGLNAIAKINNNGLHVIYCANCNNQINYLSFGGYDYCKSQRFDCKKCNKPCTGLNGSYETGYEIRTVRGHCKKCNTKIEYEG